MIVDFHAHCFPERIAKKAIINLSQQSGNMEAFHSGTVDSLRAQMRQMGVDISVVLNISTNPRQQTSVNNFAIETNSLPDIVSLGSVHPDSPDALGELERIKEAGLKGIKLHPDYQGFFADDKKMFPIYEKAGELGLITVFHAGVDIGIPEPVHCPPGVFKKILPYFGGAPVVAAHMGGYIMWKEAIRELEGVNIYLDTAYCFGNLPMIWASRIIESHGAEKILLGSDMPWSRTDNEILFIKSLGLSQDEEKMILGGNAARLLGIN